MAFFLRQRKSFKSLITFILMLLSSFWSQITCYPRIKKSWRELNNKIEALVIEFIGLIGFKVVTVYFSVRFIYYKIFCYFLDNFFSIIRENDKGIINLAGDFMPDGILWDFTPTCRCKSHKKSNKSTGGCKKKLGLGFIRRFFAISCGGIKGAFMELRDSPNTRLRA